MRANLVTADCPGEWADRAACKSKPHEWFFPAGETRSKRARPHERMFNSGRAVCAGCPVQVECLAFALATQQSWGLWGGLSTYERNHLRR